ncbi:response regulator [Geomonas sp. RF6]|uniref:response regulator transcription factor n=1 Tax=Geomonas sp. RF6 TaxID=2897342 RepID=UPI001E2FE09E|nr:response regulator [Geomonas sp. RF6]UFS69247.1 response regulator [Geomonas sp. RF6]
MARILIVDGDPLFVEGLTENIKALYPLLQVETTGDALQAREILKGERVDLLLMDLELPAPPGIDLLESALSSGMDKNRIVILSARDPEYLHERFPMGSCLAVLNKFEAKQQACLDMILSSMQRKAAALKRCPSQGGGG